MRNKLSEKNKYEGESLLNACVELLSDKHVFNLQAFDVRDVSSITDFFLIGSVNNDRQMKAAGGNLTRQLKKQGIKPLHKDGEMQNSWIVLDYLDCIIHLFLPEERERYNLEEIWKGCNFEIEIPKQKSETV